MSVRVVPGPRYSSPVEGGTAPPRRAVIPGSRYQRLGIGTSTTRPAALGGGARPASNAPQVTRRTFISARTSAAAAVRMREELQRQGDKHHNLFQRIVGNASWRSSPRKRLRSCDGR